MIYKKDIKSFVLCSILLFGCGSVIAEPNVFLCFSNSGIVSDTIIRLSDVARVSPATASNAPEGLESTVIGEAAPAGYTRFVSPEDVITYTLSKKYPEISITPSHTSRIEVKTKAFTVRIGDFENKIIGYIEAQIKWKKNNYEIKVVNVQDSVKCIGSNISTEITGLNEQYPKGNIKVKLFINDGKRVFRKDVLCRIRVKVPVLVANRNISRGEELNRDNCKVETHDITAFGYKPILCMEDLKFARALRTIKEGKVLSDNYIEYKPDIEHGDQVSIVSQKGKIKISVTGRAKESGRTGEKIWVQNLSSQKLLRSEIMAPGVVKVF